MHWKNLIQKESFANYAELRSVFRSADYVAPFTIFNVGGNRCRIVSKVEFPKQRVRIEQVLTHPEYDWWTKQYLRGKVKS